MSRILGDTAYDRPYHTPASNGREMAVPSTSDDKRVLLGRNDMQLRELNTGELFRFVDRDGVYEARGNGWFSTVDGYDGGPWYSQPGTYDLVERLQRRNARFWVWWNDGWVKLTLIPGQTLSAGYGGQHEEGWSRYSEQWTHTGNRVEREWSSEGCDCDGRSAQYGDDYAMLDELTAVVIGERGEVPAPHWRDLQASQWDEFAEAANY